MGVDLFANLCLGGMIVFFGYCFVAMIMNWDPTRKTCKHCGREFYLPLSRYRGDMHSIRAGQVWEVHKGAHK